MTKSIYFYLTVNVSIKRVFKKGAGRLFFKKINERKKSTLQKISCAQFSKKGRSKKKEVGDEWCLIEVHVHWKHSSGFLL
jgi:hypothetical protein